ncbi:hypothetical protein K8T06_04010 [bacterium]|nr:hypothetical protein [bacterium]
MKYISNWILIFLVVILLIYEHSAQCSQTQVWFTPNVGSVDMLDLFNTPEQWTSARSKINVFKFYTGQVGSGGWSCLEHTDSNCGSNHLQNIVDAQAFSKLGQWGIDIAIESFFTGPVKSYNPLECSSSEYVLALALDGSVNVIQNVQSNGGTVRYLAMDEPVRQWYPTYFHIQTGQTDPRSCLTDSLDSLADDVADYILQMNTFFPSIQIGQIELYPEVGVDQFKEWIIALETRGVALSFLHLDIHGPRVDQYISYGLDVDIAADMLELKSFLEAHNITFGIIFTDIYWNSQAWEESEYTDCFYYDRTLDWIDFVQTSNLSPDHRIFQSWVFPVYTTGFGPNEVPINLPENATSICSHTRSINEVISSTPTPGKPDQLGVRLEISSTTTHPGDEFWLKGYLDNPEPSTLRSIPVIFMLDVFGYYYFWPTWPLYHPPESEDFDFRYMDVNPGTTTIEVIPAFSWPNTGDQNIVGLHFYGAMLNSDFSSILGDFAFVEWGYCPATQ